MKLTMHSFLCATNAHNAHNCQLTVRFQDRNEVTFQINKICYACCICFRNYFEEHIIY